MIKVLRLTQIKLGDVRFSGGYEQNETAAAAFIQARNI
jgi:hypothetical protein